jgi:predicted chitinase
MITLAQFKKFAPNSKYQQQWYDTLFGPQTELGGKSLLEEYEITTPKRIAAFIAQCAHESGGFVFVTENLNYSASGLMRVFPKYFPDPATAKLYEVQISRTRDFAADRQGQLFLVRSVAGHHARRSG